MHGTCTVSGHYAQNKRNFHSLVDHLKHTLVWEMYIHLGNNYYCSCILIPFTSITHALLGMIFNIFTTKAYKGTNHHYALHLLVSLLSYNIVTEIVTLKEVMLLVYIRTCLLHLLIHH